jgi:hypothetical protein
MPELLPVVLSYQQTSVGVIVGKALDLPAQRLTVWMDSASLN